MRYLLLCFTIMFLCSCGRFTEDDFRAEAYNRIRLSNLVVKENTAFDCINIKSKDLRSGTMEWTGIIILDSADVNYTELEELKDTEVTHWLEWTPVQYMFDFGYSDDELSFIKKQSTRWYHWRDTKGRPFLFMDEEDKRVYIIIDSIYSSNPKPYRRETPKFGHYIW